MFGIIYSKNTGRIRWWIVPDNDNELNALNLKPGELLLKVDNSLYGDLFHLQDLVSQKTGLIPSNDRYAVIDSLGNVVSAIIADPLCGDQITGFQLIAHDIACPGWKYISNVF